MLDDEWAAPGAITALGAAIVGAFAVSGAVAFGAAYLLTEVVFRTSDAIRKKARQ